ncbi:sirohydrochlorin nickelochelatase [Methanobrevibacter sp. DSM 116169]|uniref:sirohydrochlorin nickelochelatase n=1 Tax=Methanobrevibacter sp. DSM 116169 TaxID=3242727 RepID=UPI0038FD310C
MNESSKTGILLLSHGSRLPYGADVINSIKEQYLNEFPNALVETGFMEMRKPDIAEAVENLKKRGNIEKIIVVPVFIAHGLHTKRDIPKILGLKAIEEAEKKHDHDHDHGHHHHHHEIQKVNFDGEIVFTDPLGDDPLILEIIKKRISNS